jgi:hypothetical protein
MPQVFKTYDADQVTLVFAGILVQGYADGDFCTIEYESDGFTDVAGTDGEVARSKTNDRRATITIELLQTSSSNALFSQLANLDLNAPNGAGVGSLLINDRQGLSLYTAAECWIQKPADATFGREVTSRSWVLRCANLISFTGGN